VHIAYVCADPGIPAFGNKGASVHIQEMLRAFLRVGARVTLISARFDTPAPADLGKVRCRYLPPRDRSNAEARVAWALSTNDAVAAALKELGPFDLIYERHALFAHGAMELAAGQNIPSVLELNAPLIDEQARHRNLDAPDEAAASARRAFAAARLITAVSPVAAQYATRFGADPARVEVVPNAVDPTRFPRVRLADGPFTVGFLGTLKPWHDVATLIEALAHLRAGALRDARLMIVGDGPERKSLADRLDGLGLQDAACFSGAVPAADVPAWLARMHVAVAPYRVDGPFYFSPLKIYEYMAAGLPVIASRVGHLPDVVADNRTGLLVPPQDPVALASAVARLAGDAGLRARLGADAREHVLAHHTWDQVAARVINATLAAPIGVVA
jgi:glycosyltransferase involved in cell wall biosynthesis